MATSKGSQITVDGIEAERIRTLNERETVTSGQYVLYWMQASVRAEYNHALEFAIARSNALNKPLACCFGVTDGYPGANERHYAFMLQGLAELQVSLKAERRVTLDIFKRSPQVIARELSQEACEVVTDMGYVRVLRQWREELGQSSPCKVWQVESNVVVPVETASDKAEFAARTIRPKIQGVASKFIKPLKPINLVNTTDVNLESRTTASKLDLSDVPMVLSSLDIDHSVPPVPGFTGGRTAASSRLQSFISDKLAKYGEDRNEPVGAIQSHLSPYVHFGQISPIEIILAVKGAKAPKAVKDNYIEQIMVRRELAVNFCWYTPNYDSLDCLDDWAKITIAQHRDDAREYVYGLAELEAGQTHDEYWNAVQLEMVVTGKMHGYMRMYWGKKVLEWTPDVDTACKWLLYLNDKYELDGRDPNGYASVMWIFGKHDRAHAERPVFGKIRYMNQQGLKRKFKTLPAYSRDMQLLAKEFVKRHGPIGVSKVVAEASKGAAGQSSSARPSGKRAASSQSASESQPTPKRRKK